MFIRAMWIVGGVLLAVVTVIAFSRPYEEVNPFPVAVGILIGYLLLMFFWFQSRTAEEKLQVHAVGSGATHSGALLEVKKINAGYGRSQILYDVSLEVRNPPILVVDFSSCEACFRAIAKIRNNRCILYKLINRWNRYPS